MSATKKNILILNGPNLNLLGEREPEVYGINKLDDIEAACRTHAESLGMTIDFRQSNLEGELVEAIQAARGTFDGLIINAAGYSHTSVSILDALKMLDIPIIEVHLSNVFKREPFRHHSYVAEVAEGVILGFGAKGYVLALDALCAVLEKDKG